MAPERLNGSNYSYGADIWHASLAQSGVRRSGIPKGWLVITPDAAAPQLGSSAPGGWLSPTDRRPHPHPRPHPHTLTLAPTLTLTRSFGLIMLEMLLGKFPYPHQENYFRLLSLIMDEEVRSPYPLPQP